jgi:hypothetical protein
MGIINKNFKFYTLLTITKTGEMRGWMDGGGRKRQLRLKSSYWITVQPL